MNLKCLRCHGELIETTANVTEKILELSINFIDIPVLKCNKCGEIHFTSAINDFMDKIIAQNIEPPKKVTYHYKR